MAKINLTHITLRFTAMSTDTPPIDRALAKGARFEQRQDGQWVAALYKRGRALPLAQLLAPTKDEAAADFLAYVQTHKSSAASRLPARKMDATSGATPRPRPSIGATPTPPSADRAAGPLHEAVGRMVNEGKE